MMPTLPATGASARTTYTGSKYTLRMSACAAANPASDSRITSSGSLISFFMCVSPKKSYHRCHLLKLAAVTRAPFQSQRGTARSGRPAGGELQAGAAQIVWLGADKSTAPGEVIIGDRAGVTLRSARSPGQFG